MIFARREEVVKELQPIERQQVSTTMGRKCPGFDRAHLAVAIPGANDWA